MTLGRIVLLGVTERVTLSRYSIIWGETNLSQLQLGAINAIYVYILIAML